MSAPDNPCAFPVENGSFERGMTLRDYFAGQALAGYMAKNNISPVDADVVAFAFYDIADAMLAERAKGGDA